MAESMDHIQAIVQIKEIMRRFTTLLAPNEKEALRLGIKALNDADVQPETGDTQSRNDRLTVALTEQRINELCAHYGLNFSECTELWQSITDYRIARDPRHTEPIPSKPPIPPERRSPNLDIRNGTPEGSKPDMVNHPPHYKAHPSGVECITIVEWFNYNMGNVIKYIWRTDEKDDPIENLRKAAWYANREIQRRLGLKEDPE